MEPITLSSSSATEKPSYHGMSAADAAKEFETMLVAQLLKIAREAGEIEEKEDEITGSDSYMEFAEKYIAEAMVKAGAFRFADAITADLESQKT